MKKLLLSLLISNLLVVPAHGMLSRFAYALARNAKHMQVPALPKIGLQSLPKTVARSAQIYKNFKPSLMVNNAFTRSTLKKLSIKNTQIPFKIMPMLGGLAASAATAQAQSKDKPAFNSANVKKYHWDMPTRKAFLEYALTQITTQDKDIIDTIATMLEHYPECQVPITNAALAQFNDAHPVLLKEVLVHNAWAKDEFVKKLITQDNPHLEKIFENYIIFGNSELFYHWRIGYGYHKRNSYYNWGIGGKDGDSQISIAQPIINTLLEHPEQAKVRAFNIVFNKITLKHSSLYLKTLTKNLRKAAIKHYGQDAKTLIALATGTLKASDITSKPLCVYQNNYANIDLDAVFAATERDIETLSLQDIEAAYNFALNYNYPWQNYPANRIKQAAQKRYRSLICTDKLSLEEQIYLHSCNHNQESTYKFTAPSTLKRPAFLYTALDSASIKKNLYRGLESIPRNYYEYIFKEILSSDVERKEFKEKVKPLLGDLPPLYNSSLLTAAIQHYDQNFPSWMIECNEQNHQATQTEKHFCANIQAVMRHMFQEHKIKHNTNAIPLFKRAIKKEREELAKGNHVFYHGRKWEYDFWADMDKMTYNLKHPNKPLTDIRLRFDDSSGALCLNYALFANAMRRSSNTASYVINNHDFSYASNTFSLRWPFKRFDLQTHFDRYKNEFEKLKKMHESCNTHGSLLMISVPDKHLSTVYPAAVGSMGHGQQARSIDGKYTTDMRTILNALKTDPNKIQDGDSDHIEFALKITPDLKDKVRIYPMSQADPVQYKEYTDYRDQLFAKIKADMNSNGGKV